MSLISDVQLSRICVSLESEDKSTRKKALDYLHTKQMCFVSPNSEFSELPTEEINAIWDTVSKKISRTLTDPSEACRNITVEIWKNFLQILPVEEKNIVYLIPILSRRLSFQEIHEPSEEVRLNYVSLLRVVIAKYSNFLAVYVDDFFAILARTVTDKYPEVKRESCQCIEELAKAVPEQFYSRSESLVKPVLSNFNHRHYKVRVASVMVIGQILQYGNSKSMEQVSTPMAERLFDQSGAVRLGEDFSILYFFFRIKSFFCFWARTGSFVFMKKIEIFMSACLVTFFENRQNCWNFIGFIQNTKKRPVTFEWFEQLIYDFITLTNELKFALMKKNSNATELTLVDF